MKKGRKSKKTIFAVAVIVIVLAVAGVYAVKGNGVQVTSFETGYGPVEKLITESGSVEARNSAVLSSKIQGQLTSVAVKEGDAVTEGQRLASYAADSGAADIGSIRAQISGLKVQSAQANDYAEKSRKLYDEGAISYEEYDQAVTAAKQLESEISSLNYSIAGLSEASGSKGVIAPMSGTVTEVMVSEGELVTPGEAMIEISDLSDVHVKVNLIADDADKVAIGDKVRLYNESNELIDDSAAVSKIYVKAQDVMSDLGIYQKRVPVEITFDAGKNLRLGSDINVEIVVDHKDNALRVPENSVFEINGQKCVYVIENGKAKLQNVEVGLEGEDYTEITSGLSEGAVVITSPAREISDGTAVKS